MQRAQYSKYKRSDAGTPERVQAALPESTQKTRAPRAAQRGNDQNQSENLGILH